MWPRESCSHPPSISPLRVLVNMYFPWALICASELEPPQGRELPPWGYCRDLLPFSLYLADSDFSIDFLHELF